MIDSLETVAEEGEKSPEKSHGSYLGGWRQHCCYQGGDLGEGTGMDEVCAAGELV